MISEGTVLFGGAELGVRLPNIVTGWNEGVGGEALVTPAEQWAQALLLPPTRAAATLTRPFAICLEIQVHSGVVGLGALRKSGARLSAEWCAYPNERPVTVILPIADPS